MLSLYHPALQRTNERTIKFGRGDAHKTTFSHRLLRFLPNSLCSHTHANLHRRTGRTSVKLPTTDHFYHHTLAGIFLRSSPEHAANIEWQSLHTNQPPEVWSCLVCVQRSTRCGQSGECMWRSLVGGFIKAVRTPMSNFWSIDPTLNCSQPHITADDTT